jgi:hypothetical protein
VAALPGASGLSWGILARFSEYVRGSGGLITASDGAVVDETGMLSWPLVDRSGFEGGAGLLRFGGTVRFVAHFGALDVPITDPEVRVDGDRGEVRIPTPGTPQAMMPLAGFTWQRADVGEGTEAWLGLDVALADPAAPLFGGSYPGGMPLDPLIVALNVSQ